MLPLLTRHPVDWESFFSILLVRCPNPKCDSQDFWVEEEKMHRFRVPKGISDLGYFDESAIKKASVLPFDSVSPRTSQE
jgi:hypothetical protein